MRARLSEDLVLYPALIASKSIVRARERQQLGHEERFESLEGGGSDEAIGAVLMLVANCVCTDRLESPITNG